MLSETEKKNIAEAIREEAYQARGIQKLLCRGKCMVPTLNDNVEVLVKDCLPDNVAIGDIILYSCQGRLMLHRFIYKKKNFGGSLRMVTKADIAVQPDPPIGADSLIGKVIEIKRNGKSVRIDRYLWPMAFRVIGVLSLLEATAWYLRAKTFNHLVVRDRYRKFILNTIKAPKLAFTRATIALMRFPKNEPEQ